MTDNKIQVFDNYLDKKIFEKIKRALLSTKFPWYFNARKVSSGANNLVPPHLDKYKEDYEGVAEQHQFIHSFLRLNGSRESIIKNIKYPNIKLLYRWDNFTNTINPLLNTINPRYWVRVKSNITSATSKNLISGWHNDLTRFETKKPWMTSKTGIFYLNTNNGYTLMENGERIDSVENRFIVFDNKTFHSGVSQTDTKIRIVINFNFIEHGDLDKDELYKDLGV